MASSSDSGGAGAISVVVSTIPTTAASVSSGTLAVTITTTSCTLVTTTTTSTISSHPTTTTSSTLVNATSSHPGTSVTPRRRLSQIKVIGVGGEDRCCGHWFPSSKTYHRHLAERALSDPPHQMKLLELGMVRCSHCTVWVHMDSMNSHLRKSHGIVKVNRTGKVVTNKTVSELTKAVSDAAPVGTNFVIKVSGHDAQKACIGGITNSPVKSVTKTNTVKLVATPSSTLYHKIKSLQQTKANGTGKFIIPKSMPIQQTKSNGNGKFIIPKSMPIQQTKANGNGKLIIPKSMSKTLPFVNVGPRIVMKSIGSQKVVTLSGNCKIVPQSSSQISSSVNSVSSLKLSTSDSTLSIYKGDSLTAKPLASQGNTQNVNKKNTTEKKVSTVKIKVKPDKPSSSQVPVSSSIVPCDTVPKDKIIGEKTGVQEIVVPVGKPKSGKKSRKQVLKPNKSELSVLDVNTTPGSIDMKIKKRQRKSKTPVEKEAGVTFSSPLKNKKSTGKQKLRPNHDNENYTPKSGRHRSRGLRGGWNKRKRGPGRPRKTYNDDTPDLSEIDSLFEEIENEDLENDEPVIGKKLESEENVPTVELDLFTLSSLNEQVSVLLTEPKNPNFKVYASMDAIFVGDSALGDVTNQIGYVTDSNNVVFVNPGHFLFPNVEDLENFVPSPILTMKGRNIGFTPSRQVYKFNISKNIQKDGKLSKNTSTCDIISAKINSKSIESQVIAKQKENDSALRRCQGDIKIEKSDTAKLTIPRKSPLKRKRRKSKLDSESENIPALPCDSSKPKSVSPSDISESEPVVKLDLKADMSVTDELKSPKLLKGTINEVLGIEPSPCKNKKTKSSKVSSSYSRVVMQETKESSALHPSSKPKLIFPEETRLKVKSDDNESSVRTELPSSSGSDENKIVIKTNISLPKRQRRRRLRSKSALIVHRSAADHPHQAYRSVANRGSGKLSRGRLRYVSESSAGNYDGDLSKSNFKEKFLMPHPLPRKRVQSVKTEGNIVKDDQSPRTKHQSSKGEGNVAKDELLVQSLKTRHQSGKSDVSTVKEDQVAQSPRTRPQSSEKDEQLVQSSRTRQQSGNGEGSAVNDELLVQALQTRHQSGKSEVSAVKEEQSVQSSRTRQQSGKSEPNIVKEELSAAQSPRTRQQSGKAEKSIAKDDQISSSPRTRQQSGKPEGNGTKDELLIQPLRTRQQSGKIEISVTKDDQVAQSPRTRQQSGKAETGATQEEQLVPSARKRQESCNSEASSTRDEIPVQLTPGKRSQSETAKESTTKDIDLPLVQTSQEGSKAKMDSVEDSHSKETYSADQVAYPPTPPNSHIFPRKTRSSKDRAKSESSVNNQSTSLADDSTKQKRLKRRSESVSESLDITPLRTNTGLNTSTRGTKSESSVKTITGEITIDNKKTIETCEEKITEAKEKTTDTKEKTNETNFANETGEKTIETKEEENNETNEIKEITNVTDKNTNDDKEDKINEAKERTNVTDKNTNDDKEDKINEAKERTNVTDKNTTNDDKEDKINEVKERKLDDQPEDKNKIKIKEENIVGTRAVRERRPSYKLLESLAVAKSSPKASDTPRNEKHENEPENFEASESSPAVYKSSVSISTPERTADTLSPVKKKKKVKSSEVEEPYLVSPKKKNTDVGEEALLSSVIKKNINTSEVEEPLLVSPITDPCISPSREWHGRGAKLKAQVLIQDQQAGVTDSQVCPSNDSSQWLQDISSPGHKTESIVHNSSSNVPNTLESPKAPKSSNKSPKSSMSPKSQDVVTSEIPKPKSPMTPSSPNREWQARGAKLRAQVMISDPKSSIPVQYGESVDVSPTITSPPAKRIKLDISPGGMKDIRTFFSVQKSPTHIDEESISKLISPPHSSSAVHKHKTPKFKKSTQRTDIRSFFPTNTSATKRKSTSLPKVSEQLTPEKLPKIENVESENTNVQVKEEKMHTGSFGFEGFERCSRQSGIRARTLLRLVSLLNMKRWTSLGHLPFPLDQLCVWNDDLLTYKVFVKKKHGNSKF